MTSSRRHFFRPVEVYADQSWPARLAIVANRSFFFHDPESALLKKSDQLSELHSGSPQTDWSGCEKVESLRQTTGERSTALLFSSPPSALPLYLDGRTSRHPSRGDKTAIELFLTGLSGWDAGLRRRLDDAKPAG